ncbi:MAG: hypothetical protein IPN76_26040 [Saprospiraceae bacterium]|nr:hypothetical protein [Saprospiraceae bacterium]
MCGTTCTHPDKPALIDLYEATGGINWTTGNTWDTTTCNVCDWYGILCDANDRVIGIDLDGVDDDLATQTNPPGNNLVGYLPLLNMPLLEQLILNHNDLSDGPLVQLNTPNLVNFGLGATAKMSGSLPAFNYPNLEYLALCCNSFTGPIPSINCPSLIGLYMQQNQLSGSLPAALANLANLGALFLSDNQLSGCWPSEYNAFCTRNTQFFGNMGLPGGGSNLAFDAFCADGTGGCPPSAPCPAPGATFVTVTNTNDSGPGSLRQAILCVSADPALDTIKFNIDPTVFGTAPWVINLDSDLPVIGADNVVLDGTTQPNWSPGVITLVSNQSMDYGLAIVGDNCEVYGIKIDSAFVGINIQSGDGSTIGSVSKPNIILNCRIGIDISVDNNSVIGNFLGTTSDESLFGGFTNYAIGIGTDNNRIENNTITGAYHSAILTGGGFSNLISRNKIYCNGLIPNGSGRVIFHGQPATHNITSASSTAISGIAGVGNIIEVFISDNSTPCGTAPCQGKTYLGTTLADASGNWTLSAPYAAPVNDGDQVVATATAQNNTSEFSTCATVSNASLCSNDSLALVVLFTSTNGQGWANNDNWLVQGMPIETWHGITLNADGCVLGIQLIDNNLTGVLPPELGNLSSLVGLELQVNEINGSIPSTLGNLANLEFINLSENNLNGEIPLSLGNLGSLTSMFLHLNSLTGSIPDTLTNLANLEYLDLDSNLLTGSIPVALATLSKLRQLELHNNDLSGSIPYQLGEIDSLIWLNLAGNSLTGEIPPQLGNLSKLDYLNLSFNQLSGSIPSELGQLTGLQAIELQYNQLKGCFTPDLINLCSVQDKDFSNNPGLPGSGDFDAFCAGQNPAITTSVDTTLCIGESLSVGANIYTQAGNYSTTLSALVGGCDSIVNLTLAYYPSTPGSISQALCPGESLSIGNATFNQVMPTGQAILDNAAFNGCDSLVNVILSFYPLATYNLTETLCTGGSQTVNGTMYDEANPSGTVVIVGGSFHGCDSTIVVDLSFNSTVSNNWVETLCLGESIAVNGTVYDQNNPTGSEIFPNGSFLGCDSVVNINLAFYPPALSNYSQTRCPGESVIINGTEYHEANPTGAEVLTNASANGCDSTVNVNFHFIHLRNQTTRLPSVPASPSPSMARNTTSQTQPARRC